MNTGRYLRQIRNAVVFMAVIVAIGVVAAVVSGFSAGVTNQPPPACYSQGGTNLGC